MARQGDRGAPHLFAVMEIGMNGLGQSCHGASDLSINETEDGHDALTQRLLYCFLTQQWLWACMIPRDGIGYSSADLNAFVETSRHSCLQHVMPCAQSLQLVPCRGVCDRSTVVGRNPFRCHLFDCFPESGSCRISHNDAVMIIRSGNSQSLSNHRTENLGACSEQHIWPSVLGR